MESYISEKLVNTFTNLQSIGNSINLRSIDTYNSTLWEWVLRINETIKPIAYIILSFAILYALYEMMYLKEISNDSVFFMMNVGRKILSLAFCKILVDNSSALMVTVNSLFYRAIELVTNMTSNVNPNDLIITKDVFEDALRDYNFIEQIAISSEVTILCLIIDISVILVGVMVMGNMIQIYVFIAISALPVSALPSEELSSIPKNFLKKFAAISLQTLLMIIVLSMYNSLIVSSLDLTNITNITSVLLDAIKVSIVLVIALFSTSAWANSICNAM